jgi:hypothetical protein
MPLLRRPWHGVGNRFAEAGLNVFRSPFSCFLWCIPLNFI